ncbi:protein-methionine-sulfoxide reductase heme-binding subunit MsrQ [Xanthobacter agilis]|uniref:Protein-methionine-sulfoxide reductase heme-binding subunit MsrQ n=1 Tax=Xanthobacter agilis TaxID=47492 RepID=A0ABU0LA12_XANAG|nr:ferric reductase-like transmembrane domain-containing protein [Xanthobacter agilis]MDQ0503969.1 sulfoxide reductase heme-binding subunit YedZ [Xanthobacter agilis]
MSLFHERSGAFSREKTFFLLVSLLPALWLAELALRGGLGARPWTEAIHFTGLWAIRLLLLTLAITPLRQLLAAPKLFYGRRILGLAALAYALAHVGLFFIDQGVVRAASEIALRIYLTIGAVAVALLVALGATSTDGAIKRLGARRWSALHRAVYVIAPLAALHFVIQSKLDVTEAVLVSGVLVLLLLYRIAFRLAGGVTPALFAALSVGAAVLTAGSEMAWYGLATRVDPWLVAEANVSFDLGPRPMWWVLAGGLAVALLAAIRQRRAPPRRSRAAVQPN